MMKKWSVPEASLSHERIRILLSDQGAGRPAQAEGLPHNTGSSGVGLMMEQSYESDTSRKAASACRPADAGEWRQLFARSTPALFHHRAAVGSRLRGSGSLSRAGALTDHVRKSD